MVAEKHETWKGYGMEQAIFQEIKLESLGEEIGNIVCEKAKWKIQEGGTQKND